jgi:hypothetical protein
MRLLLSRALLLSLSSMLLLLHPVSARAGGDEVAPDTFGKTDAEILALGQSAWFDYYTAPERGGDSTAGMAEAYELYATAAQRRNAALPDPHGLRPLGPLLDSFGEHALNVAYHMSGGGTMWIPMYAQADCDVEEVVYGLLGGSGQPAAAPATTGLVSRDLAALDRELRAERDDPDAALYFKYAEAQAELEQLRTVYRQLKARAARLSRADSDRVLGFCHNWATAGLEMGDGG